MNKKSVNLLCLMGTVIIISGCGTGSTSSGSSSGNEGDPRAAKACIDAELDTRNSGRDTVVEYENNCSFDINVMELDGDDDSNKPVFLISANSERVVSASSSDFILGFTYGACSVPFVPDEFDPFEYRCE